MGQIFRPAGPPVLIQARASDRVPFGTGPAVARLMASGKPQLTPFFYHQNNFNALKQVLKCFPQWLTRQEPEIHQNLLRLLPEALADAATAQLLKLGLPQAIKHARSNSGNVQQRERQLHTWFDGFKTLKFLNGLRDSTSGHKNLLQVSDNAYQPLTTEALGAMRDAMVSQWGWQLQQGAA